MILSLYSEDIAQNQQPEPALNKGVFRQQSTSKSQLAEIFGIQVKFTIFCVTAGLTQPMTIPKIALLPHADVAELVDALVSGISVARRGGSSPLIRTKHHFPVLSGKT